jgi:hypothetical protein
MRISGTGASYRVATSSVLGVTIGSSACHSLIITTTRGTGACSDAPLNYSHLIAI